MAATRPLRTAAAAAGGRARLLSSTSSSAATATATDARSPPGPLPTKWKPAAGAEPVMYMGPVSFEDFLEADTNKDGRVTAAEWEAFVRKKRSQENYLQLHGVSMHIPIAPSMLKDIVQSPGFGITINGIHYSVQLQAEGESTELIRKRTLELERLGESIRKMEEQKAPLDAAAARHTKRVMSSLLGYLLLQAGVVAKLTFYSRFGWDVMEPVTYFITFGISLVGLTFFTWNRLEFSYPALAALIARRKAEKLYRKHGFDEAALMGLCRDRDRLQKQLDALMPMGRSLQL